MAVEQVIYELKDALIEALQDARERSKKIPERFQAPIIAEIRVLEMMVVILDKSIKEGAIDMNKIKTEIKTIRTGSIDELMVATRGGKVEPKILEYAGSLKPGQFQEIDPETISWAHFSGRVYALRQRGQLDNEILPVKRGEKFYLVRYTKETMPAPRKAKTNTR